MKQDSAVRHTRITPSAPSTCTCLVPTSSRAHEKLNRKRNSFSMQVGRASLPSTHGGWRVYPRRACPLHLHTGGGRCTLVVHGRSHMTRDTQGGGGAQRTHQFPAVDPTNHIASVPTSSFFATNGRITQLLIFLNSRTHRPPCRRGTYIKHEHR